MSIPVRPDRSLLHATGRRPVLAVMAVLSIVLFGLGARYAGESQARWLDRSAVALTREWFPRRSGSAARAVIDLGDPVPAAVLVALLTVACLVLRRWRLAVLAVAGPGLTVVATTLLKPVIGRTKDGDLAYPSGHMGFATALVLVAALLVVSLLQVQVRTAVAIVAGGTVVVAGGMALAMTITGYHYPTDAVGGFCTAAVVVLGLGLIVEWRDERRPHRVGVG